MTEDSNKNTEDPDTQEVDAAPTRRKNLPLMIQKQYVKDVSFESPNSPEILNIAGRPEMDISFNMNAVAIEGETDNGTLYEVTLGLEAKAHRAGKLAFIAEILYGAQVKISDDVPENKHHPMLYIEVPRYAFPFVRQLLTNLTQMGGFPPLLLTPIDFQGLYMERFSGNGNAKAEKEDKSDDKEKANA